MTTLKKLYIIGVINNKKVISMDNKFARKTIKEKINELKHGGILKGAPKFVAFSKFDVTVIVGDGAFDVPFPPPINPNL